MDLLPLECIEALLLYLMPEDIGSFSLVSRWWLDMTKDEILWKTVFVRAFGAEKNSGSTWRLACAQSFASLHSVLKTGETTLRSSPSRYRKITDFILGGNYTQEEVQGLCNLSTLQAIVTYVARAGHFAVLKRLARHIPLKIFKGFLPQAFLKSSEGGHVSQLEWILSMDHNLDINHLYVPAPGQHVSALLAASQSNSLDAARFLLTKGAMISITKREFCAGGPGRRRGWKIICVPCPISHAIVQGYTQLAKMFLNNYIESKVSRNDKARVMQGYLEQAVLHNQRELVEFLLDKKDYCQVNGMTGLSAADGVSVPLVPPKNQEAGSAQGQASNNNNTNTNNEGLLRLSAVGPAIFQTAMQGNTEMAKFLIERGADVNVRTAQRRTALHVGCYYGKTDFVKLLLDNGAEIDSKTTDGATPLSVASWKGHKAVMEVLQRELVKRKGKG